VNSGIDNLCTNLEVGWVLCLGFTGTDCQSIYTVVANDTVDNIAEAHGLNSTILLANNPQLESDSSNLYIGEVRVRPRACLARLGVPSNRSQVLAVCDNVTVPPASATSTGLTIPANASPATADEDDCE
jgi:hypothetical protein